MTKFVWLIVVTAVALQRGAWPGGDQPPSLSCGGRGGRRIALSLPLIGTSRTSPNVRLESAFGGSAEVGFRGRRVR